jgi:hypothetical protein
MLTTTLANELTGLASYVDDLAGAGVVVLEELSEAWQRGGEGVAGGAAGPSRQVVKIVDVVGKATSQVGARQFLCWDQPAVRIGRDTARMVPMIAGRDLVLGGGRPVWTSQRTVGVVIAMAAGATKFERADRGCRRPPRGQPRERLVEPCVLQVDKLGRPVSAVGEIEDPVAAEHVSNRTAQSTESAPGSLHSRRRTRSVLDRA